MGGPRGNPSTFNSNLTVLTVNKNGNVAFCRGLCLRVLLLAILSTLGGAAYGITVTVTDGGLYTLRVEVSGAPVSPGSGQFMLRNGVQQFYDYPNYYIIPDADASDGNWVAAIAMPGHMRAAASYDFMLYLRGASKPYGSVTFSFDGERVVSAVPPDWVENTLVLHLRNNTTELKEVGVSVGSTVYSVSVPPLSEQTSTRAVTGALGASIRVSADGLVWEGADDPLLIGPAGQTLTRSGRWGAPLAPRKVRVVAVNYATVPVSVPVLIDGVNFGAVNAAPSADGIDPGMTQHDVLVELPSSAFVGIGSLAPHTVVATRATTLDGVLVVTCVIDRDVANPSQSSVTVTAPAAGGAQSVVTTNPQTGVTSIDRLPAFYPTNSDTSAGGAFGGSGVAPVRGSQYGNTTGAASSAASQDAANSLAAIAANTKKAADLADRQGVEADSAVAVRDSFDGPGKAQAAADSAGAAAQQMRVRGDEVNSQYGALPPPVPAIAPADDESVELNIGPGKTVTMHLNPFSPNGPFGGLMAKAAAFIRRLIAWGIVAFFLIWVAKKVRGMIAAPFATAPFGNSLASSINSIKVLGSGGGLGYAVRLSAFAIVLVVILTMPMAVMAAVTTGLPWSELVETFGAGPSVVTSGALGKALALANTVIPWGVLMAAPVWYFVVETVLLPSQLFWMTFIKFLPI